MMRPLLNAAETRLAEVIRRLGGAEFEGVLHDWLRRCLAPDNLIMLAYRDSGPPQVLYLQSDSPQVFSELENTYLAGAYLLDPYHALHSARVTAGVYRLRDVAPDAFQRSQYFTEYYQQTTLLDELTFIAYPKPDVSLNICLGRDATSARAFSAAEVVLAQRLAPILTALVEQHWAGLAPGGGADDITAEVIGALQQRHGIRLSQRQAEVALMILRGHSTPAIGLQLGLSPQTVKVFRRQLYDKCTISSQAELFALMMPLLRVPAEQAAS
jgi:DNA-binding CsgD family transcriptional regulator